MTSRLRGAAKTINSLAKQEEDVRLKLCRAIAGAMELVKKESNLTWREWANANLRKADGSKWSMWTLYSYASFGRNPDKLDHLRKSVADHGKNARRALSNTRHFRAQTQVERPSGIILDRQVEALMFAWGNACAEAREIFLNRIADREVA